eukprot:473009-Amphidinium_carterae.1
MSSIQHARLNARPAWHESARLRRDNRAYTHMTCAQTYGCKRCACRLGGGREDPRESSRVPRPRSLRGTDPTT